MAAAAAVASRVGVRLIHDIGEWLWGFNPVPGHVTIHPRGTVLGAHLFHRIQIQSLSTASHDVSNTEGGRELILGGGFVKLNI